MVQAFISRKVAVGLSAGRRELRLCTVAERAKIATPQSARERVMGGHMTNA